MMTSFYINYVICELSTRASKANAAKGFYINYVICEFRKSPKKSLQYAKVLYKLCDM